MSGMSPQKMRFNVPATIGQAAAHEGPLRVVKSRHTPRLSGSPFYPQTRTSESLTVISPLGHFQTHASQQSKPYSITSPALASTDAGRSRPSDLAVFRLTTSSYLVGVCTGRSAGFAPALISAILGHAGAAPTSASSSFKNSDEVAGRSSPGPRPQSKRPPNARAA